MLPENLAQALDEPFEQRLAHPLLVKAYRELQNPKKRPKRLRDRNKKRAGRQRARGWHRGKS